MHGFRRTLFLSHLGLVALTLLLLGVTLSELVPDFFEAQQRDQLLLKAAQARDLVKNHLNAAGFDRALSRSRRRQLQRELKRQARLNGVRFQIINGAGGTIFDTGGKNAARTYGPNGDEVPIALAGDTNSRVRGKLSDGSPHMFLAMPVRRGGEIVGCVRVTSRILLLTPHTLDFARRLALLTAGIFVLTGLLSVALAQRLALPARRLEEATRRLAAGDLSSRVSMHRRVLGRGDEMDNLTREFNAMAEKIEAVDEERRAFLADVSHELKTPLCAIKGSAETLRDGAWQNPRMAPRFASTIVAQSNRLIRLVGDLLKLARLEAAFPPGTEKVSPEACCEPPADDERRSSTLPTSASSSTPRTLLAAGELCERAAAATGALFAEREVLLKIECEATTMRGDADLLEQLLINLLANAARHSPPGSTTTLRVGHEGDKTVLQVRDRGRGIKKEHLPKLGRRFYRVEGGRERDSGGSGLGLAICRRIALAHGGQLDIASEVGQGTVVSVTLPQ